MADNTTSGATEIVNIQVGQTGAEQTAQALNQVSQATQTVGQTATTAGQSYTSLRSQLRQATAEFQAMVRQYGATSNEAQQASTRVYGIQREIKAAQRALTNFNPKNSLQGFTTFGSAGVLAITNISTAFGVLGLSINETGTAMKTLKGLMTLVTVVDGYHGLINSFKFLDGWVDVLVKKWIAKNAVQATDTTITAANTVATVANTTAQTAQAAATQVVTTATEAETVATEAANKATKANIYVLLISLLVTLGTIIYQNLKHKQADADKTKKQQEAHDALASSLQSELVSTEKTIQKLQQYNSIAQNHNIALDKRKNAAEKVADSLNLINVSMSKQNIMMGDATKIIEERLIPAYQKLALANVLSGKIAEMQASNIIDDAKLKSLYAQRTKVTANQKEAAKANATINDVFGVTGDARNIAPDKETNDAVRNNAKAIKIIENRKKANEGLINTYKNGMTTLLKNKDVNNLYTNSLDGIITKTDKTKKANQNLNISLNDTLRTSKELLNAAKNQLNEIESKADDLTKAYDSENLSFEKLVGAEIDNYNKQVKAAKGNKTLIQNLTKQHYEILGNYAEAHNDNMLSIEEKGKQDAEKIMKDRFAFENDIDKKITELYKERDKVLKENPNDKSNILNKYGGGYSDGNNVIVSNGNGLIDMYKHLQTEQRKAFDAATDYFNLQNKINANAFKTVDEKAIDEANKKRYSSLLNDSRFSGKFEQSNMLQNANYNVTNKEGQAQLQQILTENGNDTEDEKYIKAEQDLQSKLSEITKKGTDERMQMAEDLYNLQKTQSENRAQLEQDVSDAVAGVWAKNTIAYKGFLIAENLMRTYSGIQAVWTSEAEYVKSYGATFAVPAQIAKTVLIAAQGVAAIKGIMSVNTSGKTASTASLSSASATTVTNSANSQVQDVRVTNQKDTVIRAYVTDKDLQDSTNRTQTLRSVSTF